MTGDTPPLDTLILVVYHSLKYLLLFIFSLVPSVMKPMLEKIQLITFPLFEDIKIEINWWFSNHVLNFFNLNNHELNSHRKGHMLHNISICIFPENIFSFVLWAGARNRSDVQISQQLNSFTRGNPVIRQGEECHGQLPPEMVLPHDWTYWTSKQKGYVPWS